MTTRGIWIWDPASESLVWLGPIAIPTPPPPPPPEPTLHTGLYL